MLYLSGDILIKKDIQYMNLIVVYKIKSYDSDLKILNYDIKEKNLHIPKLLLLQFSISCEN